MFDLAIIKRGLQLFGVADLRLEFDGKREVICVQYELQGQSITQEIPFEEAERAFNGPESLIQTERAGSLPVNP